MTDSDTQIEPTQEPAPPLPVSDETFAALPVAAFRVDAAGRVVRCNGAFGALVGAPCNALIGQKVWSMLRIPHASSPIATALGEGHDAETTF